MARTYTRDANGRFASGGGGGGGSKAAASRKANTARAASLRAGGTTAIGGRVKAKGFSGGKAAQRRAGGLRVNTKPQRMWLRREYAPLPSGAKSGRVKRDSNVASKLAASAAKRTERSRSKAGQRGKNMATTSKAAPNAAKTRYKELSTKVRQGKRWSAHGMQDGRVGAGAKRSLDAMVRNRGKSAPKAVKAVAKAAAAAYAAGQTARAMMTGRRRKR